MAAKNKIKFGLKNVHYAVMTTSELGVVSWETPVPIPGAVSMSLAAQGDTSKFYADNIAYYVSNSNDGYQGDLEIALIPDSFRTDVLSETLDSTDKVQVEYANAEGKQFALLYQFEGDVKASLRVLYNCTCSRPSEEGSTQDASKTPGTEKLTITASPMADGKVRAKTTEETTETVRQNWFKQVWVPGTSEV